MISVDNCPSCGNSNFRPLHSSVDTTVSHESFSINTCEGCGLGITSPRPEDTALPQYYHSEDYISHSSKSHGIVGQLYLLARRFTLRWKCNLIESYFSKGKILDYGCGTGQFLLGMKKKNWEIEGVEPSTVGKSNAEIVTGKKIHSTHFALSNQKFDVITLWHVLEHVPDLNNTLKAFHNLLNKDGGIFIAVPNYLSGDSIYYKEFWAGYDVPRHLWHFSKESMEFLLKKNGFVLKSIIPMKLDSFYISLLSEKNKGSSVPKQFIHGLTQGVKSNWKARKNKNHSSLIYFAYPI